MLSPDEAMRQAHATAREYANHGIRAFEDLTGLDPQKNPKAMAIFVSGFMQAAATDFASWTVLQASGLKPNE
jgi:hypothetical protein